MSDEELSDDHEKEKSRDHSAAEACADEKALERSPSVRRKLRALAFMTQRKHAQQKEANKKKKSWTSRLNTRYKPGSSDVCESAASCSSCICTGYKKKDDVLAESADEKVAQESCSKDIVTLENLHAVSPTASVLPPQEGATGFDSSLYTSDDWDDLARKRRAKEIEEGVEPPPWFYLQAPHQNNPPVLLPEFPVPDIPPMALTQKFAFSITPYPCLERLKEAAAFPQAFFELWERHLEGLQGYPIAHSQVDYVHCLVPDLLEITHCSFYWGKMDRYEAEKLLDKKPEGTFLLRDSAQEEFLFSVSFRRYGRTLHARIEQWNHKFSFDSHDPGVYASFTVCGLIEHYKDPTCCMFFEPMLTHPLNRCTVFSLQHMCRAAICSRISYDGVSVLNLPKKLKFYLKEYHYKQRVKIRRFDVDQ